MQTRDEFPPFPRAEVVRMHDRNQVVDEEYRPCPEPAQLAGIVAGVEPELAGIEENAVARTGLDPVPRGVLQRHARSRRSKTGLRVEEPLEHARRIGRRERGSQRPEAQDGARPSGIVANIF